MSRTNVHYCPTPMYTTVPTPPYTYTTDPHHCTPFPHTTVRHCTHYPHTTMQVVQSAQSHSITLNRELNQYQRYKANVRWSDPDYCEMCTHIY